MADQRISATRSRFQRAVERAPDINEAAYGLFRRHPLMSAGRRLAPPSILLLAPGAFIAGLLWLAPVLTVNALLIALYVFVAAISATRLTAALTPPCPAPRRRLNESELPVISVIVALYKESEVVAGLCTSLQRSDYPRDKLDVLLVLEADDAATLEAAKPAARRAGFRVLVAPAGQPRTKPRALNFALQAARGDLIAVYDAEDAPHPRQLRAAAESFAADGRLGVVQAPLGWYNGSENWLTRQFSLEYAAQFHALLPLFSRLGAPLPLGGTSNVFRRTALDASGGWDPFNVTEDADLGFRLARSGWRAGVITPGTGEEAPIEISSWIGQRSRWLKGHLVTWLVQMRDPRSLLRATGLRGLMTLQITMLANVFSALAQGPGLLLWLAGSMAIVLGEAGALTVTGVLLGLTAWLSAAICLIVGARRAGVDVRWSDLASLNAYWLCQLPAAWRALKEMHLKPYVWVKTRHGISSKRREAPDEFADHAEPDGAERSALRLERLARQPAE